MTRELKNGYVAIAKNVYDQMANHQFQWEIKAPNGETVGTTRLLKEALEISLQLGRKAS